MKPIRDQEVQAILARVRARVGAEAAPSPSPSPPPSRPAETGREGALGDGVFATIDAAVEAAWRAFQQFRACGLDQRKTIVAAVRQAMREHGRELARMAREETGLGRFEDKVKKNRLVTEKTPGPEDLEPTVYTGDRGMTVIEYAPFGVVAAITPTTNPTATIINNTIAVVSAGNALVFNVHPNAKRVSAYNVQLINRAIVAAGGPENVVTCIPEPTLESAQELMKHPRARILLVTGGPGVVQAALATRKRAITAGPGNPPVVVDETADLELAGREIVRGASFDNNVICTDEKEVFAVASVADDLLRSMTRNGAYVLKEHELRKLERVIFRQLGGPRQHGRINPEWIGKNAGVILAQIGVRAGDEVRLAVAEVPEEHSLVWTEQMMPVLPVVRVANVDRAIDLAVEAEHGFGHTAAIYSQRVDRITRMARAMNCSIFVANNATLAGLGDGGEGYTSFSIASPTGEGLTRPRSFSRERRLTVAGGLRII
ncbi:MAG: aldehyde dehydrogenase EutE [Acidobacteria bacterium]|nr:MAG: aldehyde dehydrogenase EutE [Acidobacteriota bacterium]